MAPSKKQLKMVKRSKKKASKTEVSANISLNSPAIVVVKRRTDDVERTNVAQVPADEYELISDSDLFNREWYSIANGDGGDSEFDPVRHYLDVGGHEGRPTSLAFHSAGYFAFNVDVARANLNPLLHYLAIGRGEGRRATSFEEFFEIFGGDDWRDVLFNDDGWRELQKLVTKVAKSPFYDPEWFTSEYPALVADGTNPIKYLVASEMREIVSPGPNFSSVGYLEEYPDVAAAQINPFYHYLVWGAAEGRKPVRMFRQGDRTTGGRSLDGDENALETFSPEEVEALALLRSSPLFDAAWYMTQYSDVARSGIDPAVHYLRQGAAERRRPSVYFDPEFYVGQKPGLVGSFENPLVHYLKNGRAAGLKPLALMDFTPPSRKLSAWDGDADPLVAVSGASAAKLKWARHRDIVPAATEKCLVLGNAFLARLPQDRSKLKMEPLWAFMRLLRIEPAFARMRSADNGRESPIEASFQIAAYRGLGTVLRSGTMAISDIWCPADGIIRIRAGANDSGRNSTLKPIAVRAFQADLSDPTRVRLVGEGVVGYDPSFVDLILDNAFSPVLLAATTPDGVLIELGLLPFPSLARGGAHSGEVQAISERRNLFEDFCALSDGLLRELFGWDERVDAPSEVVSSLKYRVDDALGTEQIFSAPVREWLLAIFGVRVEGVAGETDDGGYLTSVLASREGVRRPLIKRSRERSRGEVLNLPADALPTLSALVSRRMDRPAAGESLIGPYIVADRVTGRARWLVSVPGSLSALFELQPASGPISFPTLEAPESQDNRLAARQTQLPLAIQFPIISSPSMAAQLTPKAPDAAGPILRGTDNDRPSPQITILLFGAEQESSRNAVMAVARQASSDIVDLVALSADERLPCSGELKGQFPGRFLTITASGNMAIDIAEAMKRTAGDNVLLLDSSTILHDRRTLETLSTLLAQDKVASAGCGILREIQMQKGGSLLQTEAAGYFPVAVSLATAPRLVLGQPDVFSALPSATYPVIANDFACTLVRREVLLEYASDERYLFAGQHFPVQFALATLRDGWRHLCTTGVRATAAGHRLNPEELDPLGIHFVEPGNWQDLLKNVTVVQELL
jgi:hypothetical protein